MLALLLVVLACSSTRTEESPGALASAADAGVRVTMRTGAWTGDPANLEEFFTPVRVTLHNGSTHPLRIRYSELVIRSPALDFEPLPPQRLVKRNVEFRSGDPDLVPRFEHSGFRIAGHYVPSFSELRPWDYPFDVDEPWYERQFLRWTGSLPTLDMIETALPEGVLEPGGELGGFLYFETLGRPDADTLIFEADLIDARTGLSFGEVRIAWPGASNTPPVAHRLGLSHKPSG